MPNYRFKITHQNNQFKIDDVFDDWITAKTLWEAREQIESSYPKKLNYNCLYISENETNK